MDGLRDYDWQLHDDEREDDRRPGELRKSRQAFRLLARAIDLAHNSHDTRTSAETPNPTPAQTASSRGTTGDTVVTWIIGVPVGKPPRDCVPGVRVEGVRRGAVRPLAVGDGACASTSQEDGNGTRSSLSSMPVEKDAVLDKGEVSAARVETLDVQT